MGGGSRRSRGASGSAGRNNLGAARMQVLSAERAAAAAAEMEAWEQAARAAAAVARPTVRSRGAVASRATVTASPPPPQAPVVLVPSIDVEDDVPASSRPAAGVGEPWQASLPSPAQDAGRPSSRLESLPVVAWHGVGGPGSPTVATAPTQPWGVPVMGVASLAPASAPDARGARGRDACASLLGASEQLFARGAHHGTGDGRVAGDGLPAPSPAHNAADPVAHMTPESQTLTNFQSQLKPRTGTYLAANIETNLLAPAVASRRYDSRGRIVVPLPEHARYTTRPLPPPVSPPPVKDPTPVASPTASLSGAAASAGLTRAVSAAARRPHHLSSSSSGALLAVPLAHAGSQTPSLAEWSSGLATPPPGTQPPPQRDVNVGGAGAVLSLPPRRPDGTSGTGFPGGVVPPPRRPGLTPSTESAFPRSAAPKRSGEATKKAPPPKKTKAFSAAAATKVVTAAAMLAARATTPTADTAAVRPTAASGKKPPAAKSAPMTAADAALVKAVIDGMQPLCVELADAAQERQRLRDDLSRLSQKVDTQGVGQEKTVRAIVKLRDNYKPAQDSPVKDEKDVKTETEVPFSMRTVAEKLTIAAKNNSEMDLVRVEAREAHLTLAAKTKTSSEVLAHPSRAMEVLYEAAQRVRGGNAAAAETYVHSKRLLPTSKVDSNTGCKAKPKKLTVPLNLIIPHLTGKYKLWCLPPFWAALELVPPIDKATADLWLLGNEFATSDKGQKAILAMAKAFFESIGAPYRIVKQQGPGGGEYVILTVGHYLLFSSMARHELMIYARRRKRKQNGNASSFRRWVVEASPLREWLPTDARVANGMCLIDAAASRDYFYDLAAGMPAADPADIDDANPSQMAVGATDLDGPGGPTSALRAAADGGGGAVAGSRGGAPGGGAGEGDDFGAADLPTDDTVSTAANEGVQSDQGDGRCGVGMTGETGGGRGVSPGAQHRGDAGAARHGFGENEEEDGYEGSGGSGEDGERGEGGDGRGRVADGSDVDGYEGLEEEELGDNALE